jgi:UDP-N-acetylglucosamine 4-epimerase
VRHSQADIRKAEKLLGYKPTHPIGLGLKLAIEWYVYKIIDNKNQKIITAD